MNRLFIPLLVTGFLWALACGADSGGGDQDAWIDAVVETGPDVPAADPGPDGLDEGGGDIPSDGLDTGVEHVLETARRTGT